MLELRKGWKIETVKHSRGITIVYPSEIRTKKRRIYIGVSLVGETSFSLIGDSYTGDIIENDVASFSDVKKELKGIILSVFKNTKLKATKKKIHEINKIRKTQIKEWVDTLLEIGTRKGLFISKKFVATAFLKDDTVVGGYVELNTKSKKIKINLDDGFKLTVDAKDETEFEKSVKSKTEMYMGMYNLLYNLAIIWFFPDIDPNRKNK